MLNTRANINIGRYSKTNFNVGVSLCVCVFDVHKAVFLSIPYHTLPATLTSPNQDASPFKHTNSNTERNHWVRKHKEQDFHFRNKNKKKKSQWWWCCCSCRSCCVLYNSNLQDIRKMEASKKSTRDFCFLFSRCARYFWCDSLWHRSRRRRHHFFHLIWCK